MGQRVAICLEEEASRNPEIIGLEGERFDSQGWLDVYTSGDEARQGIVENAGVDEFWVVSCGDVEPINLAASVKSDVPGLHVCLVTSDACGSLFSRAHTAQIDEVLEYKAFLRRYAEVKRRMGGVSIEDRSVEEAGALAEGNHASATATTVLEPPVLLEEACKPLPATRFLQLQPQSGLVSVPSDGRAFVLTVVSGSGGAGKSSVAAIGSIIAQKMGHRTLLLDCDLQFGDVAKMVGVEKPLCLDEALMHPDLLEAELGRGGGLAVLAAPSRLEASEEVVRRLPGLLEDLVRLFDVIVVNTGASWAEQHAVLLERSSAALFLIDQRASSVRACRHALELCARCGIAVGPFQFALNRCAKGAPLTSIDVSCALQGVPVYELKDGGHDVEDYLSGGAADELIEMRNEFAKSLEQIMARLLPGGDQRPIEQMSSVGERRPLRIRSRKASRKRGKK